MNVSARDALETRETPYGSVGVVHDGDDRAAIISQNARRRDADPTLLYACIEPSLGRSEFLRKAIGWALRQRAYTAPDEVRRYIGTAEQGADNCAAA